MTIRKLVIVLAILVAAYQIGRHSGIFPGLPAPPGASVETRDSSLPSPGSQTSPSADALGDAYEHHKSNLHVQGSGVVERILPDDMEGSRHQRFIVRLPSGQTVLIAHNIDLAPRVSSLREGEAIAFSGEYEWNDRGGLIHWTHHDPQGRHPGGWLEHDGRIYQ